MTPGAAVGLLLGLPLLHMMIEVEALAGIHRLMCTQQWRHKSTNFGHTKKAQLRSHRERHHSVTNNKTE